MELPSNLTNHSLSAILDPILLNDHKISGFTQISQFTVENLTGETGLSDQEVKSAYHLELVIHINHLYSKGKTEPEIGEIIGMDEKYVRQHVKDYGLPRNFSRGTSWITAAGLKRNEKRSFYSSNKITLLYQLLESLLEKRDMTRAARLSGIGRDPAVRLIRQYHLREIAKDMKQSSLSSAQVKKAEVKAAIKASTQHIAIHPATRLFCEDGTVILASDLISNKDLANRRYLVMKQNLQLGLGRISRINPVLRKSMLVNTMSGGLLLSGSKVQLFADRTNGLVATALKDLRDESHQESVVQVRHFKQIGTRVPTMFELLDSPPEQPEVAFSFEEETMNEIKTRLVYEFESQKIACEKLKVRENHGLSEGQLRHGELRRIAKAIGYPDIHSKDFMDQVRTVRYAIQGGQGIEVDRFIVNDDLLYILGLIASDGYTMKKRRAVLGFTNKEEELVDLFRDILLKSFPSLSAKVKNPKNRKVTYDLAVNHYPLRMVLYNLNVKGDKYQFDENRAYLPIFQLPRALIAAFIRGLFDGDGTVETSSKKVGIAVFHPQRSKNVQLLIKRLNIDSKVQYSFQTEITPPGTKEAKDSDQWNIIIEGKKDIIKFHRLIRPSHPTRGPDLKKLVQRLQAKSQLSSKYNFAPLICSHLFRSVREDAGVSQVDISRKSSFGEFERGNSRTSIQRVAKFFTKLKTFNTDSQSQEYQYLDNLLNPTYNLDPVRQLLDPEKYTELHKLYRELDEPQQLLLLTVSGYLVADTGLVLAEGPNVLPLGNSAKTGLTM